MKTNKTLFPGSAQRAAQALTELILAMICSTPAYAATSNNHQPNRTAKPAEALVEQPAIAVADAYFGRITCENKSFKLWQENLSLGNAPPVSVEAIDAAFGSEIYYSLPPGEEKKGPKHLRETYANVSKIMSNLRTLAVFFGHDIHNLFADENNLRKSRGELPLAKEDFLKKFYSGEIVIRNNEIANLKDFLQVRIDEIETITRSMKYGCLGDRNFLHRQNSELSHSISASAFLIPATASALKTVDATKKEKPEERPALNSQTQNQHTKPQTTSGSKRFKHYQNFLSAGISKAALDTAMTKYFDARSNGISVNEHRMVAVDYDVEFSGKPRFWVLNLVTGNATGMVMSHGNGRGSLSNQKMPAERAAFVSNVKGSNASPTGAMILDGRKGKDESKFKYATKVRGLEPQNYNVVDRDIIIHEGVNRNGVYVDDDSGNRAGRSEGCFALSPENAKWVAENLPVGTFLYAYNGSIPNARTPAQAKEALSQ